MPFIFVLAMALSFGGGFVLSWAIPQVNPLFWWLLFTSLALVYWVWARRRYWPVGELNQWLADEDAQLDPGDRLPPISQSGGGEGSDLRSVAVRARQRLFGHGQWTPDEWEAAAGAADDERLRRYHLAHIGLTNVLVKYLERGDWVATARKARRALGDLQFDRRAKVTLMLWRAGPVTVILPIIAAIAVGPPLIGLVAPGLFPGSCAGEWVGEPPPWCTGDAAAYLTGQILASIAYVAVVIVITAWLVRVRDHSDSG